jgi:hypothetical protein
LKPPNHDQTPCGAHGKLPQKWEGGERGRTVRDMPSDGKVLFFMVHALFMLASVTLSKEKTKTTTDIVQLQLHLDNYSYTRSLEQISQIEVHATLNFFVLTTSTKPSSREEM